MAPGYVFCAPKNGPDEAGPGQDGCLILDHEGKPVWFRPLQREGWDVMAFSIQRYRERPVLGWWEGPHTGYGQGVRKAALAAHIALAVGWVGALAGYLALDVAATTSRDPQTLRACYLAMGIIAYYVIIPLALASLLSGLLMSLGTRWGLFRNYWVMISFLLTTLATVVLLVQTRTIGGLAGAAADPATCATELRALGSTLAHSVGGTAVLLVVLALNVYKPRGMTRYGWRKEERLRGALPRGEPNDRRAV